MQGCDKIYDRRAFLVKAVKFNAGLCIACSMPGIAIGCSQPQIKTDSPENFYMSNQAKLLKNFDTNMAAGKGVLAERLGESPAINILAAAKQKFEAIIPEIPYIGGDQNDNSTNQLVMAANYLALYRVLSEAGMQVHEIGQVIYDMFDARLQSSPHFLVSMWGYFKYHVGWKEKIANYAAMSQKRTYPMDFAYVYIEGDGRKLDYGVNMMACAIQKFYRAQLAEDLVPYMCALDYPLSKRFNRGLIRTQTLVESNVCDFRYRKDRKTRLNLPAGLQV